MKALKAGLWLSMLVPRGLVDLTAAFLARGKAGKRAVSTNISRNVLWPLVGLGVIAIGLINRGTAPSLISNLVATSSVTEISAEDVQAAPLETYAGVYETGASSPGCTGGLGLFASGRYTLILGPGGTRQSGTWTVEGRTIRLKSSSAGDTVLSILGVEGFACDVHGAQVIFRPKDANDPSPSIFYLLAYPTPVSDTVPGS